MPQAVAFQSADLCGDLRPLIDARRLRRARLALAAVAALAAVPLAASMAVKPPVLLVWNSSASAPVGLYRIRPGASLRRGDMVVARTPEAVRSLAAERRYLPANVPLVKRVAAAGGDRICAAGATVRVGGLSAATRLERDSWGRPMPSWSGCRTLGRGEYLLLMDDPRSFDGRYFGATRSGELVGKAVLVWAR